MLGAYRRPISGEQHTENDKVAYQVDGPNGVLELARLFRTRAGINDSPSDWPSSPSDMRRLQRDCPTLNDFFKDIDANGFAVYAHPSHPGKNYRLTLDAGNILVASTSSSSTNDPTFELRGLVVLPAILRPMALKFFHDGLGHPGMTKTFATMILTYWWPSVSADVRNYVGTCRGCHLRKASAAPDVPIHRYNSIRQNSYP